MWAALRVYVILHTGCHLAIMWISVFISFECTGIGNTTPILGYHKWLGWLGSSGAGWGGCVLYVSRHKSDIGINCSISDISNSERIRRVEEEGERGRVREWEEEAEEQRAAITILHFMIAICIGIGNEARMNQVKFRFYVKSVIY